MRCLLGLAVAVGVALPAAGCESDDDGDLLPLPSPGERVKGDVPSIKTDGVVSPGAIEEVVVRGMPRRGELEASVSPLLGVNHCGAENYVCGVRLEPAADSPGFKTSPRGEATLTFGVPAQYFRKQIVDGSTEEFEFNDGERIRIGISALGRFPHQKAGKLVGVRADLTVSIE